VPAERGPWSVPAYAFSMQTAGGEYMGRIRLRVGWSEDVIRYAGHVESVRDLWCFSMPTLGPDLNWSTSTPRSRNGGGYTRSHPKDSFATRSMAVNNIQ